MTGEIVTLSLVPSDPDLDEGVIEGLIAEHDGSVRKIAKALGVSSARLRKFVAMSSRLTAAIDEVFEGAVDEAVGVLFEGLRDEGSFQNRFYAAKEFLRTGTARKRGFGHEASGQATLELKDKGGARTITLRWLEPQEEAAIEEEPA
jgi:hypothetical protein